MGLDNGICVKRTPTSEKIPELRAFEEEWDKEHRFNFEVCYWRKCWNIRSIILDVVDCGFDKEYRLTLTIDDIDRITEALKSLTAENWEDEGWCIWEFDEMKENLERQIYNLGVLKRLMQEHELEVYFYDSY
jgi:hypothetical protein